jgi:hypothetical protein
MKKLGYLFFVLAIMLSCSTKRQVAKAVNSGNYNSAISDAVDKLRKNKTSRRSEELILLLEDAYYKANSRDLNTISGLKASKNPEYYRRIYETYVGLDRRQALIKPLLPLVVDGNEIAFKFKNYNKQIATYSDKTAAHLYEEALELLRYEDKATIREAYDTLDYIEGINPNYRDTRNLLNEAHARGMAHVVVTIENATAQVIPAALEEALLDFNTYGLDQFWTTFHNQNDSRTNYDFAMQLQLQQITMSPEQVKERELVRERRVQDGWEYVLDRNGNVRKDSLGNDIKRDKFADVEALVLEVQQFKSSQIIGQVVIVDTQTNELIVQFPLESGFVFENIFATFTGDERALIEEDIALAQGAAVPFPTNEQMIFDAGQDLKSQLKGILRQIRL